MKVRIIIDADLTGISRGALIECESDLTQAIDEAVEGGEYFLTHPDTEREYECDISVASVQIEKF